jgi:hypothetical protein
MAVLRTGEGFVSQMVFQVRWEVPACVGCAAGFRVFDCFLQIAQLVEIHVLNVDDPVGFADVRNGKLRVHKHFVERSVLKKRHRDRRRLRFNFRRVICRQQRRLLLIRS